MNIMQDNLDLDHYQKENSKTLVLPEYSIKYFTIGSGTAILILNPVGQKMELWAPLVQNLVEHYKVIWVSDIAFNDSCSYRELQYCSDTPKYFLDSIVSVLDEEGIDKFISLSWCAASKLALELSARLKNRVLFDVYLAPSLAGMEEYGDLDSDFEKDLFKMMSMVNSNKSIASLVIGLFQKTMEREMSEASDDASGMVTKLAYSPFLTESSIINLSERIVRFFSHDVSALIRDGCTNKHVFVAENDKSTSSLRAKKYFSNSINFSITEIPGADHYLPFKNPKFICEYLLKLCCQNIEKNICT